MRNHRRAVVLSAGLWAACVALLLRVGPRPADLPRSWAALLASIARDPQAALGSAAGTVAWLVLGWLTLGAAACLAARLPRTAGRLADGIARLVLPRALRRLVELALGLSLAAGTAVPAMAATSAPIPSLGRPVLTSTTLAPLPPVPTPVVAAPERPPVPSLGRPRDPSPQAGGLLQRAEASRDAAAAEDAVVVHRGDCLWSIVARHLGPEATPGEIAAAWPRWYAANRRALGGDPDRLLPGQRLRPPPR